MGAAVGVFVVLAPYLALPRPTAGVSEGKGGGGNTPRCGGELIHKGEIRRIADPLSGSCQIPGHGGLMHTEMLKHRMVRGGRGKEKCQGRERSRGKEISGGRLLKQQAGEGSSASACTGWGSALPMDRAGFDSGVSSSGVFGGAWGQAGCAGFVLGSRTRNIRGCFSIQCRWS